MKMTSANISSLLKEVESSQITSMIPEESLLESVLNSVPIDFVKEDSSIVIISLPLLIVTFLMYIILNFIVFVVRGESLQKRLGEVRRVLLVIAHPDDECMFFGPALSELSGTAEVYLACLSDGGFEGVGGRRQAELWQSCRCLGLTDARLRLYRHPLLPDNPRASWSPPLVSQLITQLIETFAIDTLITFDSYGVSGHLNHSSIYRAIMHLIGKRGIPSYCRVYALESVGIIRKYSMCADLLLSYFLSNYIYVCSSARRQMILDAMAQHSSQLLWYRRLYLMFSRYTYINTFRLIS